MRRTTPPQRPRACTVGLERASGRAPGWRGGGQRPSFTIYLQEQARGASSSVSFVHCDIKRERAHRLPSSRTVSVTLQHFSIPTCASVSSFKLPRGRPEVGLPVPVSQCDIKRVLPPEIQDLHQHRTSAGFDVVAATYSTTKGLRVLGADGRGRRLRGSRRPTYFYPRTNEFNGTVTTAGEAALDEGGRTTALKLRVDA